MSVKTSASRFFLLLCTLSIAGAAPPEGCGGAGSLVPCNDPSFVTFSVAADRCVRIQVTPTAPHAEELEAEEFLLCPSSYGSSVFTKRMTSGAYQVHVEPLREGAEAIPLDYPEEITLACGESKPLRIVTPGSPPNLEELLAGADLRPGVPDLSEGLQIDGVLPALRSEPSSCEDQSPDFGRYQASRFGISGLLEQISKNREYLETFFSRETYVDPDGVTRTNPFYEYALQNGPVLYEERSEIDSGELVTLKVNEPYLSWNGGSDVAGTYWVGQSEVRDRVGHARAGDLLILRRGGSGQGIAHYVFEDRTHPLTGLYDPDRLNWIHYRNMLPKTWELETLLIQNECYPDWMSSEYRFRGRLPQADGTAFRDDGSAWPWTRYESTTIFACQLTYLQYGPRVEPLEFLNRKLMDLTGSEEITLHSDDTGAYLMAYEWPITCDTELLFPSY